MRLVRVHPIADMSESPVPPPVYKICDRSSWLEAQRRGTFAGSADDLRDGFIHLSTASQVVGTLQRHFAGRSDLLLIAVDADDLGSALRWEPARDGALFPHLYAPLDPRKARSAQPLELGPDGKHLLPEGFAAC